MSASLIPGSFADLKAVCGNGDQAPFGPWGQRNRELIAKVACGAVECCGEWQRPGYYGWCSLLTRPAGETLENSMCPIALQMRNEHTRQSKQPVGSSSSQDKACLVASSGEPTGALNEGESVCRS